MFRKKVVGFHQMLQTAIFDLECKYKKVLKINFG